MRQSTRLAPSPTGALHLGNAFAFVINWTLARQRDWRVVLRIDDLDSPRVKAGADRGAIDDLIWLGLDWDDGPTWQTACMAHYAAALARLDQAGHLYPCTCTRREIESAQSAPHESRHDLRYPGTCRHRRGEKIDPAQTAMRVIVPDERIEFHDELCGDQSINVQRQVGDFIVATKAGLPAYQLAVVVDDALAGVNQVVRGRDLLDSTARQILLHRLLLTTALPSYWHLPLIVGPDGHRLAKRHGDSRLKAYRDLGVTPERIIGLIAWWAKVSDHREPMTLADFVQRFTVDVLHGESITCTMEDHQWLTHGTK